MHLGAGGGGHILRASNRILISRAALPSPFSWRDTHCPRILPLVQDRGDHQPIPEHELVPHLRIALTEQKGHGIDQSSRAPGNPVLQPRGRLVQILHPGR